jgi:dTDP-4-dehydrorhamnose reductase
MEGTLEPGRIRPTLLVTGVESSLGANLALSLTDQLSVVGFFQGPPFYLDGCETLRWEPDNVADLRWRIRRVSPQWILHCGSIARGSWDMSDVAPDGNLEARTCLRLAAIAAEAGICLTVISTDAVFAGPRMFHNEKSEPTNGEPLAIAARQVEQALEPTGALIVRTHAYGWSNATAEPCLAERIWQALADGLPCRVDSDQHATPILASDLAHLLWRAYQRGLKGLRHIAGAERTSAYLFAREMASAFDLPNCITAAEGDYAIPPNRTHLSETSLDTRLARNELEQPMPLLREGLEKYAQQLGSGLRARLRAWQRAA